MGRNMLKYIILLLLCVGGNAINRKVRLLQQDTVGSKHWHKFEDLNFLYPNADLETFYQSPQDAGYFTVKRPGFRINSVSDESIFKIKLYSNGIISLNDGNLTSRIHYPKTFNLRAPSFLPVRTDDEADAALRYGRDLYLYSLRVNAAKHRLESQLQSISHCNSHGNTDAHGVPWLITESYPERPNFLLTASTGASVVEFRELSGESVNARILHVVLSDRLGYTDESEINGSFDVLYTLDPEPRIRYISIPGAETSNGDSEIQPNFSQIIRGAKNPVRDMLHAQKKADSIAKTEAAQAAGLAEDSTGETTDAISSSIKETYYKELARARNRKLQEAGERNEGLENERKKKTVQYPLVSSSSPETKGTIVVPLVLIPLPHLQPPEEESKSADSAITKIFKTNPMPHIQEYCLSSSHRCRDKRSTPNLLRSKPFVFVSWAFSLVVWVLCIGFSTCEIVRFVRSRWHKGYQTIKPDNGTVTNEKERVVVLSLDYYFTVPSPEDREFKKPLLSAISEKDEEG